MSQPVEEEKEQLNSEANQNEEQDSNIFPLAPNGGLLDCLVLCAWDNVVGPQAKFSWRRPFTSQADQERLETAMKYTVSHTLHGELGKSTVDSLRKARGHELYLVEDAGFIVYSVPFTASRSKVHLLSAQYHHHQTTPTRLLPHSLALVLSGFQLRRFRDLQPLIHLYMQRFACCVRAYLHKEDYTSVVAELTPVVQQFCNNLASLSRPFNYLHSLEEVKMKKWNQLELILTSHLQTCGCSVVVGDSVKEINSIIKVLSQFLRPNERHRVRYATKYNSPPYHPGILIQGMVKSISGEVNILTEDILFNVLPTTIVDLSQEQVLRSWLLHEHVRQRQIQFKGELISLLCDQKPIAALTENVFQRVTEPSRLVSDFVKNVWAVASDATQRRNQINIFNKQLEYYALALIKLVNSNYKREPSASECPRQIDRRKLMKKLDLSDELDFLVVLAIAEKLQQGIYLTLANEST